MTPSSSPPKIISCPICKARFDAERETDHWGTHVAETPAGEGDFAGQFTWTCECGPTAMHWPTAEAASDGLALHMQIRHNIPL